MGEKEIEVMRKKILKGVRLAHKRLLEKAKREDRELVFAKRGKVVIVKARDL